MVSRTTDLMQTVHMQHTPVQKKNGYKHACNIRSKLAYSTVSKSHILNFQGLKTAMLATKQFTHKCVSRQLEGICLCALP